MVHRTRGERWAADRLPAAYSLERVIALESQLQMMRQTAWLGLKQPVRARLLETLRTSGAMAQLDVASLALADKLFHDRAAEVHDDGHARLA